MAHMMHGTEVRHPIPDDPVRAVFEERKRVIYKQLNGLRDAVVTLYGVGDQFRGVQEIERYLAFLGEEDSNDPSNPYRQEAG